MRNYWSCTPFADWIRGTAKPTVGTAEEWNNWDKSAKAAYPIRYWIVEEGLDKVQSFFRSPIELVNNIRYYVNNRWVTKTHCLTAHRQDIKPGEWRDVGNRFLPCLFNELVDFIEVELAWHHVAWSDDEERKKYDAPRSHFIRGWRCKQAGIDHLKWEMTLTWDKEYCSPENVGKPTHQAIAAKEKFELYTWWTETYRNRLDPYDASGWSALCNRAREENEGKYSMLLPKGNDTESKTALDLLHKIEEDYRKEDEEMMIRLIKIRDSLWT